jgi:hypothetical protein
MDTDPGYLKIEQPALFEFTEAASTGTVELFPAVWSATEGLIAPEEETRRAALQHLEELGAPRLSPLVAYLLATRLNEPDLDLRCAVVRALGDLLAHDDQGRITPETVRRPLRIYLSQMRTRAIFSLLEVVVYKPQQASHVAHLLNACPFGGNHLLEILSNRKAPMPVRKRAAEFIGLVGYLDVLPGLERLAARLESRVVGQQSMPFAPPSGPNESELLPTVQTSLAMLRTL